MWNRTLIGLVVGVCCYGGIALIVLVLASFIIGTGDFAEWGTGGRGATVAAIMSSWWLAVIPLEAAEVRKSIADGLAAHLRGDDDA